MKDWIASLAAGVSMLKMGVFMKSLSGRTLSRREFARRAAVLSATASLAPAEVMLSREPAAPAGVRVQGSSSLSAGQAEADLRYQQILRLFGDRFTDEQKADLQRMCAELQTGLEHIRSFKLENGDAPGVYLKPLVEREKKPSAAPAAKKG